MGQEEDPMRRMFRGMKSRAAQISCLLLVLLANESRSAVIVDIDLDPVTPGVQDSLLVAPGSTVTAAGSSAAGRSPVPLTGWAPEPAGGRPG